MPKGDVRVGDGRKVGIEFDTFYTKEGKLGGEEHGPSFAGTNVEENGFFDRLGGGALEPYI